MNRKIAVNGLKMAEVRVHQGWNLRVWIGYCNKLTESSSDCAFPDDNFSVFICFLM